MTNISNSKNSDLDLFNQSLEQAINGLGLQINSNQRTMIWAHLQLVLEANRQFNLTRITSPADAAVKHYADSISLLCIPGIDPEKPLTVLDVGTGAGFPAIPLAIMCPAWWITAIDSTGKKARFVAKTIAKLGLTNVQATQARAIEYAHATSQQFDLVLLRAVSKLAKALEEVHRLVAPAGQIVFYKTPGLDADELHSGHKAAQTLGLKPLDPIDLTLATEQEHIQRRFIRYIRC